MNSIREFTAASSTGRALLVHETVYRLMLALRDKGIHSRIAEPVADDCKRVLVDLELTETPMALEGWRDGVLKNAVSVIMKSITDGIGDGKEICMFNHLDHPAAWASRIVSDPEGGISLMATWPDPCHMKISVLWDRPT